ncbi:Ubiquitin carboxyl-terminal hydrolase 16, partial [Diplonema papillatum]
MLELADEFSVSPSSDLRGAINDFKSAPAEFYGLQNRGNTCYINSVLQCLLKATPFGASAHRLRRDHHCEDPCFVCLLSALVKPDSREAAASRLGRHVNALSPNLKAYSQEDAHEFCRSLLEKVSQSLLKKHRAKAPPPPPPPPAACEPAFSAESPASVRTPPNACSTPTTPGGPLEAGWEGTPVSKCLDSSVATHSNPNEPDPAGSRPQSNNDDCSSPSPSLSPHPSPVLTARRLDEHALRSPANDADGGGGNQAANSATQAASITTTEPDPLVSFLLQDDCFAADADGRGVAAAGERGAGVPEAPAAGPPPLREAPRTEQERRQAELLAVEQTTLVNRMFGGWLLSSLACHGCGVASGTRQPFGEISVPVAGSTTVTQGLFDSLRGETVEYKCPFCKQRTTAEKSASILEPPPVLVVQLQRFRHGVLGVEKVGKAITFDTTLDVAPAMHKGAGGAAAAQVYNLSGVLMHHGRTPQLGHYTATVSHNGRWVHYNDSSVVSVSESAVLASQPYLLFYLRADACPPSSRREAADYPAAPYSPPPPAARSVRPTVRLSRQAAPENPVAPSQSLKRPLPKEELQAAKRRPAARRRTADHAAAAAAAKEHREKVVGLEKRHKEGMKRFLNDQDADREAIFEKMQLAGRKMMRAPPKNALGFNSVKNGSKSDESGKEEEPEAKDVVSSRESVVTDLSANLCGSVASEEAAMMKVDEPRTADLFLLINGGQGIGDMPDPHGVLATAAIKTAYARALRVPRSSLSLRLLNRSSLDLKRPQSYVSGCFRCPQSPRVEKLKLLSLPVSVRCNGQRIQLSVQVFTGPDPGFYEKFQEASFSPYLANGVYADAFASAKQRLPFGSESNLFEALSALQNSPEKLLACRDASLVEKGFAFLTRVQAGAPVSSLVGELLSLISH